MKAKDSNQSIGRNDYARFLLATFKTFLLSTVTVFLIGPFVLRAAVQLWYFDEIPADDSFALSLSMKIASNLAIIHQILCPILILTSYKECRFHLAVLCLCCCKDKKETLERDYKQYYATFVITHAGNEVHLML